MVRGAALGRAQTLDGVGFGVGLGQSIGGFVAMGQSVDSIDSTASLYENGRIIKGYQAGPNVVDGSYQAMLNAYSNAKYNRQMRPADRAALREQLERKMVFTDRIQFRDKNSNNVHYKAFTTENNGEALSVFNANLLNNDIGKQLDIATVLQHEGHRNGRSSRGPPSVADRRETRNAVESHWRYQQMLSNSRHGRAYIGALDEESYNDYQKGQDYLADRINEEEAHRYVDQNYSSQADGWIESGWDALSLATGIGSLIYNIKKGNYVRVAIDTVGALADGAALLLPLVPGGAGIAIKTARGVGAAASITDGTLNTKDGIKDGDYIQAGLGAVQIVSGGMQSKNLGKWTIQKKIQKTNNPLAGKTRIASANKIDAMHNFNDIIDNYSRYAKRFNIPTKIEGGKVDRISELYQIQGSLNGKDGIFEWIIDQGSVTHRRFIPKGEITGYPNQKTIRW